LTLKDWKLRCQSLPIQFGGKVFYRDAKLAGGRLEKTAVAGRALRVQFEIAYRTVAQEDGLMSCPQPVPCRAFVHQLLHVAAHTLKSVARLFEEPANNARVVVTKKPECG
jgi:hypothetical protein